jgi:Rho GDP-dissociation inhibitor
VILTALGGICSGYNPTAAKSIDEYAKLDANDESLARWKASLGITGDAPAGDPSKPKVWVYIMLLCAYCFGILNESLVLSPLKLTLERLELTSPTLPAGKTISVDVSSEAACAKLKENPIRVKEGAEYKFVVV